MKAMQRHGFAETQGASGSNSGASRSARDAARVALAGFLIASGFSHLSWARTSFRAQVPGWVPGNIDTIVMLSGAAEIALGTSLALARSKWPSRISAAFFVAVFPGNMAQYVNRADAFGLDAELKRLSRLFFQPVLLAWAIWSARPGRHAPDQRHVTNTRHE